MGINQNIMGIMLQFWARPIAPSQQQSISVNDIKLGSRVNNPATPTLSNNYSQSKQSTCDKVVGYGKEACAARILSGMVAKQYGSYSFSNSRDVRAECDKEEADGEARCICKGER